MSLSMYQASVPVFIRAFDNLLTILDKGAAYAAEQGIEPAALIESRLAPDMLNLAGQIQRASDTAKGCAARLGGAEMPSFADNETSIDELKARIAKTVDFLRGFAPAQLDGSEAREVTLKTRSSETRYVGADYLLGFALPNFFFHVTTAYDILRHRGVPVGKQDYLGRR